MSARCKAGHCPPRLAVATFHGFRECRVLLWLGNGVCIIRAIDAPGFSVTHAPTGLAFFSQIRSGAIARKVAMITASIADWSKATSVPECRGILNALPEELREWFPRACREFADETIEAAKRRAA